MMGIRGTIYPVFYGKYRIAQYFHPEKNFTFFALVQPRVFTNIGEIFFSELLSENFVTLKHLHVDAHDFTRGCQAVLTVSHGHQLFLTIQKRSLYRSAS